MCNSIYMKYFPAKKNPNEFLKGCLWKQKGKSKKLQKKHL